MSTFYDPCDTLPLYQPKALETALPAALEWDYLLPGLVAETGEVMGVVAKAYRDGWSAEARREALTKEWGDVAWFVAVSLYQINVHTLPERVTMLDQKAGLDTDYQTCVQRLSAEAPWVLQSGRTPHTAAFREDLLNLWAMLVRYSLPVTGRTFSTVLSYNLAKLADRAERGKLKGSGDDR